MSYERRNLERTKKGKFKLEYKLEMIFGLIGGLILLILGATGSAEFYLKLIEIGESYFGKSTATETLALSFKVLASLGGITVMVGSLLIGYGRRRLGGWFIGIGAGISLSSLIIKIIVLGPTLQSYIQLGEYGKAVGLFGLEFGLLGLGVFLAFLAMLTNYRWMLYMFVMSMLAMFVGATGDLSLLEKLITALNLPVEYLSYLGYLESLLLYIGLVFLLTTLIVGANRFRVAKSIVILGLIGLLPALFTIFMTLVFSGSTTLFLVRTVTVLVLLLGEIYFIFKATPVHKE